MNSVVGRCGKCQSRDLIRAADKVMPQGDGGGAACKQVVLTGGMNTTEYVEAKLSRCLK